jgi:hypothetical protein
MHVAADKAIAHAADPSTYPLPDDQGSLEQVFFRHFQALPPDQQQAAQTNVMSVISGSEEAKAAAYGDLAQLDLTSATPVEAQVASLGLPDSATFSLDHLTALFGTGGGLTPQSMRETEFVNLSLVKVHCDRVTGTFGWADDDIYVMGVGLDSSLANVVLRPDDSLDHVDVSQVAQKFHEHLGSMSSGHVFEPAMDARRAELRGALAGRRCREQYRGPNSSRR